MAIQRWLCVCCLFGASYSTSFDKVKDLMEFLTIGNYRTDIRPIQNQSKAIEVNIQHVLRSIVDVDIAEGYIITASEFIICWRDEHLVWNSSDYHGIKKIPLQHNMFWIPVVTVLDAADGVNLELIEHRYSPAWVTSDGVVSVFPAATFRSKCRIDGSMYPLDMHTCVIHAMSAKYGPDEVNLNTNHTVLSEDFLENVMWEVTDSYADIKTYTKHSYQFADVLYTLTVSRKLLFSSFSPWIPPTGMIWLNMISPFIPLETRERLTYCVTIYLAVVIASDLLLESMPQKSESISFTAILLIMYNFMNTLTVAWTVLIICLSKRTDTIPGWIRQRLVKTNKTENMQEESNTVEGDDEKENAERMTNLSNNIASTYETKPKCGDEITWKHVTKKLDTLYVYFFISFYCLLGIVGYILILKNRILKS